MTEFHEVEDLKLDYTALELGMGDSVPKERVQKYMSHRECAVCWSYATQARRMADCRAVVHTRQQRLAIVLVVAAQTGTGVVM